MYKSTQTSPLFWILLTIPALAFVAAWILRSDLVLSFTIATFGVIVFLFVHSFKTLTISDQGKYLDVRFGPLRLFGTKVEYRDITSAQSDRSSMIDGWGIHWVPLRGWTMNLWGFECVKIMRGDLVLRVGTNDSENLARLVQSRIESNA